MKKLLLFTLPVIMLAAFTKMDGYKVGDKVGDISLKNIDGKNVALSGYKNAKGFIVVFTTNHCPYAVRYQERINALNVKYEKAGYPVIAVNSDDSDSNPMDSYTNMQKRAMEQHFTFPYLLDAEQKVGKEYGATKTPEVFVLQKKDGALIVKYTGAIDDNTEYPAAVTKKYVELAVDALLAGKEVQVASTKAIGCGIKYK